MDYQDQSAALESLHDLRDGINENGLNSYGEREVVEAIESVLLAFGLVRN